MNEPDLRAVEDCAKSLAKAMMSKPLSSSIAISLAKHLLYSQEFKGIAGREAFHAVKNGIITEREYRNLVISHFATRISVENSKELPSLDRCLSEDLCLRFEKALLGREAVKANQDLSDPWD